MYPQFSIIHVNLNPTQGSEQSGIRPCLVISNTESNISSNTCVVAIISSVVKEYPHTLIVPPTAKNGLKTVSRIDFLQIKTIDYSRIKQSIGFLDEGYISVAFAALKKAFSIR